MAPAKFDDLSKAAKDVLNDDYFLKGIAVKNKLKTNFEGLNDVTGGEKGTCCEKMVVTTAVDMNFDSGTATPAKLTFKLPKPFGVKGFAIDKFEMDKAGGLKLEAGVDKALHTVSDLNVDLKSDCKGLDSLKVGLTYTGIAAMLAKAEFSAMNPAAYSAEASYNVGSGLTLGAKSSPKSMVDAGLQYINGPAAIAATAQENFSQFQFHASYKVNGDMSVAAAYNHGGKQNGNFNVGLSHKIFDGTSFKGKFNQVGGEHSISTGVKHRLAKGTTITTGVHMPVNAPANGTWGMQVNIE